MTRRPLAWLGLLGVLACQDAAVCESSLHVETLSPDERLGAWVFVRSCGAGQPSSANVSILPSDSLPPSDVGNTFVIEPIAEVAVEWTGEHRLLITHGPGETRRQNFQAAGVTVTYQQK